MSEPGQPPALAQKRPQPLQDLAEADQNTEQAGRSPTGLHAHNSSASLTSLARRASGNVRPHTSRAPSIASPRDPLSPQSASPPLSPAIPSQSPSTQEAVTTPASESSRESVSSTSKDGLPNRTGKPTGPAAVGGVAAASAIAKASRLAPPPRLPQQSSSQVSSRDSSFSMPRNERPRSLRELGSDYTRYYNPFVSRNSSSTSLALGSSEHARSSNLDVSSNVHAAPASLVLPAAATATATATPKRNSDPFDDKKRLSAIVSEPLADNESVYHESEQDAQAEGLLTHTTSTANTTPQGSNYRQLDPEKSFFPYLDDRLGAPGAEAAGYTFPLLWDEKEDDDDMHMPMVDDDKNFRPTLRQRFSRENFSSLLGVVFMLSGVITLIIILPVLSTTNVKMISYPYDSPASDFPDPAGEAWAKINDRKYPLMKNMRSGLIDPDTPASAQTKTSKWDGAELQLVFSDEFNDQNRTFYEGDDPFFFGFDGWYGATQDLEYYDPDAITTNDGVLEIRMDKFANHGLNYRSGMLNSWNQLCFKGGIWEVSVSLPAPAGVHGFWPGVWSMGNLGRPGYLATTDGMWPYTYNDCDVGITPNQSMTDGTSRLPGQRLPSCTCSGADHPTPGTGRGAPEIDILEGAADWQFKGLATATQSYQVAPFDVWYYPNYDYFMTPNYSLSWVNSYTGGPYQQAVSTVTMLNNDWFDGKAYQTYSYDYNPGTGKDSWIAWLVGDEIMGGFDGRTIGKNGNIQERLISEEPMSMIINSGFSTAWTVIDWDALVFPNVMRVDYVRLYQRTGSESVTCDPLGYETTEYINAHPAAYKNPNVTHWSDAGYSWPKNSFMHGCSSSSD